VTVSQDAQQGQNLLPVRDFDANYFSLARDEKRAIYFGPELYVVTFQGTKTALRKLPWNVRPDLSGAILQTRAQSLVIACKQPVIVKQTTGEAVPGAAYITYPYRLRLIDNLSGKEIWVRKEEGARTLVLSPAGDLAYVTFAKQNPKHKGWGDSIIAAWLEAVRTADGKSLWRTPEIPSYGWDSPAVSPDGKFLAIRDVSTSPQPAVKIFETRGGQLRATLSARELIPPQPSPNGTTGWASGKQLEFSPDGRRLAMTTLRKIFIWNDISWTHRP
jgi:WD40 repeat protein